MTTVWLAAIVFTAFGIEAALGFGCNVLAVTVGVHLLPLPRLLPVLVILNLIVSTWIVARHRDAIDWQMLLRRILPLMLVGLPVGLVLFAVVTGRWLEGIFGLFVVVLALVELLRVLRSSRLAAATPRPLSQPAALVSLFGAGLLHGLYAAGGPLAVYFSSREIADKRRFRSTLSLLWLLLNAVLLITYAARGLVTTTTITLAAPQLVPLVAGIVAGERLHARIDERTFRLLVFTLLALAGAALALATLTRP